MPTVCVQLPVYREEAVLDQLLTAARSIEYPDNLLSIVVIDDSNGPAQEEAAAICARHSAEDARVSYFHRDDRVGYKAGALNYSDARTKAELLAVFDADFVPDPQFLLKTVAHFAEPQVAAVQTRWTYRNADAPLTLLQAAIFEAVFSFECVVRTRLGVPALFMGTSGVWRRAAIESVGGWREVPFTAEDVDLSYRATNAGYRVAYVHEALSSCEATDSFLAFKNQQRRWARGIFQASADNAAGVLRVPHGLLASLLDTSVLALQLSMPSVLLLQALTATMVFIGQARSQLWLHEQVALSVLLVLMPVGFQLMLGQRLLHEDWLRRALLLLRSFALGVGLSVAVWAGLLDVLFRSRQEFVRTPKQGGTGLVAGNHRSWLRFSLVGAVVEGFLALLGGAASVLALARGYTEALVPLLLLTAGAGGACAASVREAAREWRRRSRSVVAVVA
ncbi:MAG TPA: glycosyltransferase family 2 protein, partial [Polyangiaceae bacterium]|nr:glycosyltransferase family 2 protein [Polyangiaceae bacterium]